MAQGEEMTAPYRVLARKYRPRRFEDLIGQDPMVRVLRNAFAKGRIAHAFIFTGVRGVGKTTTARILARALNYEKNGECATGPSLELDEDGDHCAAIAEGRHPDVLEMDAASRTGVADVRELIEGVRYAPVSARRKVYIIDEVHMLSTAAFNGLLKTLEEPPPHVTFIFATTDIQKVPATVLSRCQRFDLRRVGPDLMAEYLGRIAEREGAGVEADARALLARASEGSVRDGLSLLDQALAEAGEGAAVTAAGVRAMLGLADRGVALDLFDHVARGAAKEALGVFDALYDDGVDPEALIRDLMEIAHALSRLKLSDRGREDPAVDAARMARLVALAEGLSLGALARLWKMLLSGLEDVRAAPDPGAAAEMVIIRVAYAGDLPDPEDLKRLLKGASVASAGSATSAPASSGAAPSDEAAASPLKDRHGAVAGESEAARLPAQGDLVTERAGDATSPEDWAGLVALAKARRDLKLYEDLRRFARPVRVERGRVAFRPEPQAPADLAGRLKARLDLWTGRAWAVTVTMEDAGQPTLAERDRAAMETARADAMAHPIVKAALEAFEGAELIVGPPVRRVDEDDRSDGEDPAADAPHLAREGDKR